MRLPACALAALMLASACDGGPAPAASPPRDARSDATDTTSRTDAPAPRADLTDPPDGMTLRLPAPASPTS